MPGAAKQRFVIKHDDTYLYCIDTNDLGGHHAADRAVVYADNQPTTRISTSDHHFWYATDHQAHALSVQPAPNQITTGFRLDDPTMASVRYPLELDVDTFNATFEDDDDRFRYSRVTREEPAALRTIAEDADTWPLLDGYAPDYRPHTAEWKPSLPTALRARREYHHLFPGSLHGLRQHLEGLIKAMANVRYCFNGYEGKAGLFVTLTLPFETPQEYWEADSRARRRGAGRMRQRLVDRELHLLPADSVSGANYAEALAAWDEQVEFWVGVVERATVKACERCAGHGFVPAGSAEFERGPAVSCD